MDDCELTFASKDDFPIKVVYSCFTHYSHFPTNIDKTNHNLLSKQKNVIIGGYDVNNGFHELIVDDKTRLINYKSFEKDYKKRFANLKHAGVHVDHAQFTHSYLVQNNKYLVVFYLDHYYNVYDMENDKWLIQPNKKHLEMKSVQSFSQSVLINDEIMIVSCCKDICFHFIGGKYITNPILLHSYELKTDEFTMDDHRMCVIDFIKQESTAQDGKEEATNELHETYRIKIVFFGGDYKNSSKLLFLDILLSYTGINVVDILITETIEMKSSSTNNDDDGNLVKNHDPVLFGFVNVLNSKQEPIVITVGGKTTMSGTESKRSVHLFNCVTKELIWYQNVCYLFISLHFVCVINIFVCFSIF